MVRSEIGTIGAMCAMPRTAMLFAMLLAACFTAHSSAFCVPQVRPKTNHEHAPTRLLLYLPTCHYCYNKLIYCGCCCSLCPSRKNAHRRCMALVHKYLPGCGYSLGQQQLQILTCCCHTGSLNQNFFYVCSYISEWIQ